MLHVESAALSLAFFQNIGPVGLVIILIIALIIFGKRLPDVARSMGKGIVEFKKGLRGVEDELDQAGHDSPPPAPPAAAAPPTPGGGSDQNPRD